MFLTVLKSLAFILQVIRIAHGHVGLTVVVRDHGLLVVENRYDVVRMSCDFTESTYYLPWTSGRQSSVV